MYPVPWQCKIIGKIILSRIPLSYRYWNKIGIFKHGKMKDALYAIEVFKKHFGVAQFGRKNGGFVALELGPGDSLYSAPIAYAYGAKEVYLVDAGNYVADDIESYKRLIHEELDVNKTQCDEISSVSNVEEMLKHCNARYLTDGLPSLKTIPDKSVDFIWSQAVLEHIRRDEFADTMSELRRILREDGVCSHHVDLKDHLGGSLNHLRFSDRVWESALFSKSGFYTNRLRFSEMLHIFKTSGFDADVVATKNWSELPIRRSKLNWRFAELSDLELCMSGFDLLLRRAS